MKRTTTLLGTFAIMFGFTIGVLVVPDNAAQQDETPDSPQCKEDAWRSLAPSDSQWSAFPNERECALRDASGEYIVDLTVPHLELALHPADQTVSVSGTGFNPDAGMSIDVRILTDGIIGGPRFLTVQTNHQGHFASAPLKVTCPEPDSDIYIVATDDSGVAHAARFSTDGLYCQVETGHDLQYI